MRKKNVNLVTLLGMLLWKVLTHASGLFVELEQH